MNRPRRRYIGAANKSPPWPVQPKHRADVAYYRGTMLTRWNTASPPTPSKTSPERQLEWYRVLSKGVSFVKNINQFLRIGGFVRFASGIGPNGGKSDHDGGLAR